MSVGVSRSLILLRHAKAVSPRPGQADADRPLSESGLADAESVGTWLVACQHYPDLVLCSPARRTKETWLAALEGMRKAGVPLAEAAVAYVPTLYNDGVDSLIRLLAEIPDEIGCAAVVGHNPTMSVVSAVLDPAGGNGTGLKTASIAVHQVVGPWKSCARGMVPLLASHTARAS